MGQSTSLVRPRSVSGDGEGLVSRAGLIWLGETADLCGLTAGLSAATARLARRRYDPGRSLAQVVVALADGATCLSDLAVLRNQPRLFGRVGSQTTIWRTFAQMGTAEFRGLDAARAAARRRAWAAGAGPSESDVLFIDIDATIVRTRADKQDAAPTYKRTYGHHPLLAMIADTDEVLAGMMRPGNAGANDAADHLAVLADAINQLPPQWRAGHDAGDEGETTIRTIVVRADSAGASHLLTEECRDRNLAFSVGHPITGSVRDALLLVQEEDWIPATDGNGRSRDGAQVVEITDLINLEKWPEATRLIVRRERPHPGAQLSLFDTIEGMRHTAFITDRPSTDIASLELDQRRRARAEAVIRDTKACGLANLPFDDIVSNDAWMRLCFTANDLLSWAQRISLTGPLRRATPKTIRHRLLHVAATITPAGHHLHLDARWPWTTTLLDALTRTRNALRPLTVTKAAAS
jgi:hypothetical protein